VTWAEKYIASGLTALLVATEPMLVVLMNWAITRKRPNVKVLLGVLVGLGGVALLVGGQLKSASDGTLMSLIGIAVVLGASLAWAGGSVYSNRHPMNAPTSMASGMQMLAGGFLLFLLGAIVGDFKGLNLAQASWVSVLALVYLIVFGALIAFTAYGWLLRNVSPTLAATYAYVNPVVAVFLGWLIAKEPVTISIVVGAAIIVGSVVLITTFGRDDSKRNEELRESDCPSPPCA
jgi:drug/metabolite transporter (DMT)-like permease